MAHEIEPDTGGTNDDRSLGELFAELSKETTALVRAEVNLAKVELSKTATSVGRDVGFLAAGGAVAYAGLLALIAAAVLGLIQLGLAWWLAALLVGLLVLAVGGFLVWRGINNLKNEDLAPRQTIETVKEDVQWAKEQTK